MIRFKMKRKKAWIAAAVITLVLGSAAIATMSGGIKAEVEKVSKGEIKQYIEETALVIPKEKQTVYIEGAGKVIDIRVDVGDAVRKGDLLLSLDKADLELQLKDAEAKVEASRAQVKSTDIINYANKIELAKAAVNQAQTLFDTAKRNFDNSKNLYESQALSKDAFEKAQDAYKTAQSALDSAKLQLTEVRKGVPDYVKSGYEAQLEQAVILRDTIMRKLQKQELKAQIDGVVLERQIEANSLAAPSTAAFVIADINHLELEADVLADEANKISTGDEVEISGKALNDTIVKGQVSKIAPSAKSVVSALGVNQKRVAVTINILEATNLLKPGYSVDIKLITDRKNDIIIVPDSAVFDYQGKSGVLVVENGKAVTRAVVKGISGSKHIEILEGLKEGETILVKPDNKIKEGMKIQPAEINNK